MRRAAATAAALVLAASTAACSGDEPEAPAPSTSPTALPEGFAEERVDGLRLAVPEPWEPRVAEERLAPSAALETGVPREEGGAFPPPNLIVFVERQQLLTLDQRASALTRELEQRLVAADVGEAEPVEVPGAQGARRFEVVYESPGGVLPTGEQVDAAEVRQLEVLVERDGLPDYGLRYRARADAYDEAVADALVDSLAVGDVAPTA